MNGKGDAPRPFSVSRKWYEENWELAFGKKQINVPSPLHLRKLDVPLIENEIKPLVNLPYVDDHFIDRLNEMNKKDNSDKILAELGIIDKPNFDTKLGEMYGKFRVEKENNRGLRESADNTPEASGSTIQPPS